MFSCKCFQQLVLMKNKQNLLIFDFPFFFLGKEVRSYVKELTYDTKDMNGFENNVMDILKKSFWVKWSSR